MKDKEDALDKRIRELEKALEEFRIQNPILQIKLELYLDDGVITK